MAKLHEALGGVAAVPPARLDEALPAEAPAPTREDEEAETPAGDDEMGFEDPADLAQFVRAAGSEEQDDAAFGAAVRARFRTRPQGGESRLPPRQSVKTTSAGAASSLRQTQADLQRQERSAAVDGRRASTGA